VAAQALTCGRGSGASAPSGFPDPGEDGRAREARTASRRRRKRRLTGRAPALRLRPGSQILVKTAARARLARPLGGVASDASGRSIRIRLACLFGSVADEPGERLLALLVPLPRFYTRSFLEL